MIQAYLADKGPALLPTWLYQQMPTGPLLALDRIHTTAMRKGRGGKFFVGPHGEGVMQNAM